MSEFTVFRKAFLSYFYFKILYLVHHTQIRVTCNNNLISCSLFRQSFLETLIANKNEDDDNNLAGAVYRYSSLMTFLSPKWHSISLVTLKGSKKSRALEKSRFCAKRPFRILEMAPFSDFQWLITIMARLIYSTVTLLVNIFLVSCCLNVTIFSKNKLAFILPASLRFTSVYLQYTIY
jgi:hypothetical protein